MSKFRELWLRSRTCLVPPHRKSDQGASIIEYAAVIILVAAVAAAIFAIGIPEQIRGAVNSSITEILNSGNSDGPEQPD
ncbi:hypothetical protein GCM10007147_15170 [Nocardiopsis kunsanensis]|uniref:Flp family type IVb pilin n=1 Tax=Nocardiopsis kunsanensis TaxID=141693 RepID=A0A918XBC3_9ACTN|nr:hypothetical protein [Nocardiopsis kunsanensis]GHD21589.1 hypothetical protein GCM10007147_15170 [Nocardiopsis kunsanensis]